MNIPKISVIVPVYRVEKYLLECIDSILAQTYSDFELLLIDDGSPDQSGAICDEYAIRDSRIRVFHKENGGVSSARNLGLKHAKGVWIMFVDSDDTIMSDCLEVCMGYIDHCDVDLLQFKHSQSIDYADVIYDKLLGKVDYLKMKHPVCIGGAIFKTAIIQHTGLHFDEQIKLGEDQLFIYEYIFSSDKCIYINRMLYDYRVNEQSATKTMKHDDILMSIDAFLNLKKNYPVVTKKVNNILLCLFFDKAIIKREGMRCLMMIYKQMQITECPEVNSYSIKIFFYLSRFNRFLAICWAKLYHALR